MENTGHFYVTLPCSTFDNLFSENTLARYTTPMNPYIYFRDSEYEVALVELAARTYLYNISENDQAGISIRFKDHYGQKVKYRLFLPSSYYKDVFEIIDMIDSMMINHAVLREIKIVVLDGKDGSQVNLNNKDSPRPSINRCYINIVNRFHSKSSLNLLKSLDGIKFLGVLSDMFETRSSTYNLEVLTPKSRLKNLKILNQNTSRTLYIYTNVIEHQYLGDDKSKLLRTILLEKPHGDLTYESFHKEFANPHYVKVEGSVHRTIDINIRTVTGELAPFAPGELLVKLHFRPVKYDE